MTNLQFGKLILKKNIMKKNKINSNKYLKDRFLWLVFSLFIIIGFWLMINHHPWRDEAQAWLISRDLSVKEVFLQMPYEGTPPLWHLIIMPFAKLNLPYESILGVHFLIAILSIFILIFYSPLPKIIKIILPFNYYLMFEYAIIARNYNLSILFLFIIAALHKKRYRRPILYGFLIALLSWTNVHSLIISLIILGLFIYNIIREKLILKNSHLISIGIALSGIVSAILIMLPYSNQITGLNYMGLTNIGRSMALAAFPFLNHESLFVVEPVFYWLISLIWLPIIFNLIKNWKYKLGFIFSWLWLLFIYTFKHPGDLRHYGLMLIFFIFFWWLDYYNNETKNLNLKKFKKMKSELMVSYILLFFILVNGLLYNIGFIIYHQGKFFSGAKEMAIFIKTNDLIEEKISAYPSYVGTSLLPYLPNKNIYQFETLKEGTYLTWDKKFYIRQNMSYFVLKNEMKKYYKEKNNDIKYVLFITNIPPEVDEELELITKTTKPTIKSDEYLYLYKIKIK